MYFTLRPSLPPPSPEDFPPEWLSYLQDNVLLYRVLTEEEQARLCVRVLTFIAAKHWEGCAGLEITDEIQVTVAAQACLLLLGFDDYCFDELKTVLLYPGGYLASDPYEPDDRGHHRLGEAHWKGPVVLSWWHALWDGRQLGQSNLVLHEFAHKLAELGDPWGGMPPMADAALAERWDTVIAAEYKRLVEDTSYDRPTLLHPYGCANRAEFFAVATESFFLQPGPLRQRHPALYEVLAGCYRQDPAARRAFDPADLAQVREARHAYACHAVAECSAALRRLPDCVDAHRNRAGWYWNLGEYDRAAADYSSVIRLTDGPEQAEACCDRGMTHQANGRLAQALFDFDRAIQLQPDFAAAYRERGVTQAKRGNFEQAFADFARAIRLDPKDDQTYVARGRVYCDKAEYHKAIRDFTKAIRLYPYAASVYSYRARANLGQGEHERALADCDEAIQLDPSFAEPYRHRGVAHYHLGALEKAIADLTQAIRLDPDDAEAYRARALAHSAAGEEEKAQLDRARAAALAPANATEESSG